MKFEITRNGLKSNQSNHSNSRAKGFQKKKSKWKWNPDTGMRNEQNGTQMGRKWDAQNDKNKMNEKKKPTGRPFASTLLEDDK